MEALKQTLAVTGMNLRSLPQRVGASMVIVIGIAGVVAVLVSVLAMGSGMTKTIQSAGRDDRAIVLRNGSASETGGQISREAVRVIMNAAGIRHDLTGRPLASAEVMTQLTLHKRGDGADVNATLRGVGRALASVRPETAIVEGRMFSVAVNELIVGKAAYAQFDLAIGGTVSTRGGTWTVVGVFENHGDAHESELMTDADTLLSSEQRNVFQSVTAVLESPESFTAFEDALTSNPALSVDVFREREYFERQSASVSQLLFVIAYIVGGIMAIGAVFGALNTMYSAVSARTREIATLRAIGFGSGAMVTSVLIEAVVLALVGGAIGGLLVWLFLNGDTVSTAAGRIGRGQLVFEIAVTPQLFLRGLVLSALIGLIGGLFPGIRAARMPIVTGLRAI